MKHLILFCIAITASIISIAQKDFEGEINYKLVPRVNPDRPKGSDNDTLQAQVFFGPQRLRVILSEDKEQAEAETLIMLDSGLVYRINKKARSFTRSALSEIAADFKLNANTVLGYAVSPVEVSNWGHIGGYAQLLLADELHYHIPDKYKLNMEVMMVRNDKIILKGQVIITSLFGMMEPGRNRDESVIVDINAISVKPGSLPLSHFQVPADYLLEDYSRIVSDTMATYDAPDTVAAPALVDTATYEPAKPVKKPATTKPPVKKPVNKTNTPAKSSIRKEQ